MDYMLRIIDESEVDWHELKSVMYSSEIPNKRSVDITLGYLQGRQFLLKNNKALEPYHMKESLFSGEDKDNLIRYVFPMFNALELAKSNMSPEERAIYCQYDDPYNLIQKIFRMVDIQELKLNRIKEQETQRQLEKEKIELAAKNKAMKSKERVNSRLNLIRNNCEPGFYEWYDKCVKERKLPSIENTQGLCTSMCYLQVHEDKSSTLYIQNRWKITLSDLEYKTKYKQLSLALFGKVEGIRDTRFDKTFIPTSILNGTKNIFLLIFYVVIGWFLLQVFGDFGSAVLRP